MEDIWRSQLRSKGWPDRAVVQFPLCWAKSTLYSYNSVLNKLCVFCTNHGHEFPPVEEGVLAGFMCELSDSSTKPRSLLNTASAAISALYQAIGFSDLSQSISIKKLSSALVKSGSSQPMKCSTVMPVEDFRQLFFGLGDNKLLSIKDLRMKVVCLLSLSLMLRPSDIAPKSVFFDASTQKQLPIVLKVSDIQFCEDGSASVTLFGIKNDIHRSGFTVELQKHSNAVLDPVQALKTYIQRTERQRPPERPVFLSLTSPYHAISAATVASILEDSISRAGLSGRGFSAKSFRPTGASVAIEKGLDPKVVQSVGRWKSTEVFYAHYVHCRIPQDFVDKLVS